MLEGLKERVCRANVELLARMASATASIARDFGPIPETVLDKHYVRKHGPGNVGEEQRRGGRQ